MSCEGKIQQLYDWSFWACTGRPSSQGCLTISMPQLKSWSQETTLPAVMLVPAIHARAWGTSKIWHWEPLPQWRKSQNP